MCTGSKIRGVLSFMLIYTEPRSKSALYFSVAILFFKEYIKLIQNQKQKTKKQFAWCYWKKNGNAFE